MIVGDLFSGIGGFSLAAHWHGWRTAWFSEIDPYACRVLAKHWPEVPNLGDITKVDWSTVQPVDVLTGGFPCQPHSLAGLRKSSADERDLFDEIIRAAGVLRPRYLLLENVPGLLTSESGRFFGRVLGALAALGYDAEWRVLSAADVGAPHRRERVWIVAHANSIGRFQHPQPHQRTATEQQASRRRDDERRGADVGDADSGRCKQRDANVGPNAVAGTRHPSVVDPTRGGRGAGAGLAARRADGGRAGLGDAVVARPQGHARDGDDGHQPGRNGTGSRGPVAAPGVPVGWSDAVAVRGADNTVRRIPREAAEGGPQSPLRALVDGLSGDVVRQVDYGENVQNWKTSHGLNNEHGQQGGAFTKQVYSFGRGASGTLWPVADGVDGRVAKLKGLGNSIVPRCAYEVMRTIVAMEQTRADA